MSEEMKKNYTEFINAIKKKLDEDSNKSMDTYNSYFEILKIAVLENFIERPYEYVLSLQKSYNKKVNKQDEMSLKIEDLLKKSSYLEALNVIIMASDCNLSCISYILYKISYELINKDLIHTSDTIKENIMNYLLHVSVNTTNDYQDEIVNKIKKEITEKLNIKKRW